MLTEALTRKLLRREECWIWEGRVKESEGRENGLGRELGIERVEEEGNLGEKSEDLGFRDEKREEAEVVVAEHAMVWDDDGKCYEVEMKWFGFCGVR